MLRVVLLFICIITSYAGFGQSKEGYIRYTADVIPLDSTEENIQAAQYFRKSKIEIYYSQNCCRVDYQTGEISKTSTIGDRSKNTYLFLANNGKTKVAQKIILDSLPETPKSTNSKISIRKDTLKEILGFNCYFVSLNENGKISTYWCTDELKINFQGKSIVDEQIPGFPLMIRKEEMGFIFIYTVSNYRDFIEDHSVFSTEIPEGYLDASGMLKPKNK